MGFLLLQEFKELVFVFSPLAYVPDRAIFDCIRLQRSRYSHADVRTLRTQRAMTFVTNQTCNAQPDAVQISGSLYRRLFLSV